MLEAHQAADLAVVDAQAGQQVDRAVAHVLELAACRPRSGRRSTRDRRLVGRARLADADARLLVHTEQRAISEWAEQQFDDGHGFGRELGIAVIHPDVKDGPGGACGV
jgi:hypothetical protein